MTESEHPAPLVDQPGDPEEIAAQASVDQVEAMLRDGVEETAKKCKDEDDVAEATLWASIVQSLVLSTKELRIAYNRVEVSITMESPEEKPDA